MNIKKKKIRTLDRLFADIYPEADIIIGLTSFDRHFSKIVQLGFASDSQDGDTILPPSSFGPVSLFNANGREIIHRDQPKEKAYKQTVNSMVEFRNYDRITKDYVSEQIYERNPLTFIYPPSIELTITQDLDDRRILITPLIKFNKKNHDIIVHTINLFLEIFGECDVTELNRRSFRHQQLRHLNWQILTKNWLPWEQLGEKLREVVDRQQKDEQSAINYRLRIVNDLKPDFVAVGQGGFDGCIFFAFPNKGIFIMECLNLGNATNVLDKPWDVISRMTKAEILESGNKHSSLPHRENWATGLKALLQ